MKMEIGIPRLDELVGGGLPARSATMALGPPFSGTQTLARTYALHGMAQRIPAVIVLTDRPASEERALLAAMDPDFAAYETEGLIQFVDAHSRLIGAGEELSHCQYVGSSADLNQLAAAVNAAQRELIGQHSDHRLVLDTASTLITHTNAPTVFRFLQVFLGRAKLTGATSLILVVAGIHADEEVQMLRHLVDNAIEMRESEGVSQLRIELPNSSNAKGWVDYDLDRTHLELSARSEP